MIAGTRITWDGSQKGLERRFAKLNTPILCKDQGVVMLVKCMATTFLTSEKFSIFKAVLSEHRGNTDLRDWRRETRVICGVGDRDDWSDRWENGHPDVEERPAQILEEISTYKTERRIYA